MTQNVEQFETQLHSGETILQALLRVSGLPESILVDAASKGAVWLSRQRGRGRTRPQRIRSIAIVVEEDSMVMLNYNPHVLASVALPMRRVSDHVNYSIWFKPSGMLCQGSKWSDHTVATEVAAQICQQPSFLVHRLDKSACGLMVIAHTRNALRQLNVLFEQRKIKKTYQALVCGLFESTLPLRIERPVDDREAITTVHSCEFDQSSDQSTLSLTIDTGRKHQIRKHLAELGHPIIGDRLYSKAGTVQQDHVNLQLVACALEFRCPFTHTEVVVAIDGRKALNAEILS